MTNSDLEDKLDRLLRVTTRTETQVKALMEADAGTRLTTIETTQKNNKYFLGLAMALPTIVLSGLRYFKMV